MMVDKDLQITLIKTIAFAFSLIKLALSQSYSVKQMHQIIHTSLAC